MTRHSLRCPSIAAATTLVLAVTSMPALAARSADAGHQRQPPRLHAGHRVGLGRVLSTRDGGQIFGWDINAEGNDGVLTSSQDTAEGYKVSVETFDQTTGKITNSFGRHDGPRISYKADGIFAGDIALITRYVVREGTFLARRRYDLMNPVTDQRFTGSWSPPLKNFDVLQNAENQSTSASVLYGIELKHGDIPDLVVSDLGTGTSTAITLDPDEFSLNFDPELAQDTTLNRAVIAYSPDSGQPGGAPPATALINLKTGEVTQFSGYNNGPYGAGAINGVAVDSTTDVEATTTELNAQVEFYNLKTRTGIAAVQLPGTVDGQQLNSAEAIAVDPVHHLFLVADPVYAPTGGSAIVVYNEAGNLIEAITGFTFSDRFSAVPIRVAVNPSQRIGWVDGPGINQLQQFFY